MLRNIDNENLKEKLGEPPKRQHGMKEYRAYWNKYYYYRYREKLLENKKNCIITKKK